jgi:hypothetical protein
MKNLVRAMLPVALLAVTTQAAQAQRFGPQLSFGTDSDFGIGGRVEFNLGSAVGASGAFSRMFGLASFDYFFLDCDTALTDFDCSWWELNANAAIPITSSTVDPYVGGGLNFARVAIDTGTPGIEGSDSEVGLNLLGGLRFPLGGLSAFGEARFELAGGDQLVLTFGALFGSR